MTSPSRRWPPGRRYARPGGPSCATCRLWHIDPDTLAGGFCFYTAKGAPKRVPLTLEAHTCDHWHPRFSLHKEGAA